MVDWVQTVFEFSAVVIGVLLAFEIDRHHEDRLNDARAKEFLELIREELEQNTVSLNGVLAAMQNTDMEFRVLGYRLRDFAWLSLSSRIALVKNEKLRRDIITCYCKFDLHEQSMNRYSDLYYALIKQLPNPYDKLENQVAEVRAAIANQLSPQRKEASLLVFTPIVVEEINEEIKKLTDC